MLQKPALLAMVLAVFLLVLAACGGDDSPSSTGQPPPAAAPATAGESSPVQISDILPSTPSTIEAPPSVVQVTSATAALSTIDVVKLLKPSVVQIVTELSAMGSMNQAEPSRGVGTGIILDVEGHILTNFHVISGAQSITAILNNGDSHPAQLIGGDPSTDTAVIKIEAEGLQPAKLGSSADLQVGEEVIAIGHALGLPGGPTVSKEVVSALGRSIDTDPLTTMVDLIQTDASINPGNSGGPLANALGEVVGINTAVIRGSQGIGFAINIDDAQVVAEQLRTVGYVDRGFLGISPVNLSSSLAARVGVSGVSIEEGIVVARVVPGSAAEVAGLLVEDVIVQLGGEPIANTGVLSRFPVNHPPGETVLVVFYRGEARMTVQLTLGERPTG